MATDHWQGLEDAMTPNRRSERERRDEAQCNAESLVEEALREVPRSDLKQVLSLRMDPQLIRSLRRIAGERGTTVSDLLREAATEIVNSTAVPTVVTYRAIPPTTRPQTTSPATGHSSGEQTAVSSSPSRVSGYA